MDRPRNEVVIVGETGRIIAEMTDVAIAYRTLPQLVGQLHYLFNYGDPAAYHRVKVFADSEYLSLISVVENVTYDPDAEDLHQYSHLITIGLIYDRENHIWTTHS